MEIDQTVRLPIMHHHRDAMLKRFLLRNNQIFADYKYKNLWWVLNNEMLGYGDLREADLRRISVTLHFEEEFIGWNEHHGSRFQQTKTPIVRITHNNIMLREDIIEKEGR